MAWLVGAGFHPHDAARRRGLRGGLPGRGQAGGGEFLGRTPIQNVRIPAAYLRWTIKKEGFETLERAFRSGLEPNLQFTLDRQGTVPAGMVRVPGGTLQYRSAPAVQLQEYWLDKYEVTNKQFKEFVDQGGYQKRDYWKEPFVKDGRGRSWEEAMAEFRDSTGRPGPSTWELGSSRRPLEPKVKRTPMPPSMSTMESILVAPVWKEKL